MFSQSNSTLGMKQYDIKFNAAMYWLNQSIILIMIIWRESTSHMSSEVINNLHGLSIL